MFTEADLIHSYTRAEALADGMLIDVSETAKEAGFRHPVAVTCAAWADCVEWTDDNNTHGRYQDQSGRLWDVLWMAINAAKRQPNSSRLTYSLYRVLREGRSIKPKLVSLVLDCGPGDDPSPVMTIGFPSDF